jgi:hypothetical protein
MSDVICYGSNSKTIGKSEDGKFYVQTTFYDDAALHRNNDIRLSGMLNKGKLGLHDNEDIRGVISCPSVEQWNIFKKKHKPTMDLLNSKDESTRMKGFKQVEILEPNWVVYSRT